MISRVAEFIFFGVAPLLIGLAALPANLSAAERTIAGEVLYRERIALPPDAAVLVQLLDVSLADALEDHLLSRPSSPQGRFRSPSNYPSTRTGSNPAGPMRCRPASPSAAQSGSSPIRAIRSIRRSSPQSLLLKMVHQSETPPSKTIFDRTWLAEDIEAARRHRHRAIHLPAWV